MFFTADDTAEQIPAQLAMPGRGSKQKASPLPSSLALASSEPLLACTTPQVTRPNDAGGLLPASGPAVQQLVLPYLMDLDSTNGTFINGERIEGRRYYELREKDLLKFGSSSREYVLLKDDSA